MNRSRRDFSERDRSVFDLIRPNLAQAYRNAVDRTILREREDAAERALWSSSTAALASLTKREHDVLVLVADGKTNLQVGDRLSLSPRTVQKHLEHIYDKLGIRSRTAMTLGHGSYGVGPAREPTATR